MKARLIVLFVSLIGFVGAAAASAQNAFADHAGNREVGPYAAAVVSCSSSAWNFSSRGTMEISGLVGAASIYDRQTVAWIVYIRNESTGAGFFLHDWRTVLHQRVTYDNVFDPWSPTGTRLQQSVSKYAPASSGSWDVVPGRYSVHTRYSWLTSTGWVNSEWVLTTSYTQNGIPSAHCIM